MYVSGTTPTADNDDTGTGAVGGTPFALALPFRADAAMLGLYPGTGMGTGARLGRAD